MRLLDILLGLPSLHTPNLQLRYKNHLFLTHIKDNVADPDPGSGIQDPVPFWPWITIRDPQEVFSGSRISDSSLKIDRNFFLQHFKNKIIFSFVKFVATKKGMTSNFFIPLFCCCFCIRDPRSGIRDG
jgi:hypothetical protein